VPRYQRESVCRAAILNRELAGVASLGEYQSRDGDERSYGSEPEDEHPFDEIRAQSGEIDSQPRLLSCCPPSIGK